MNFDNAEEVLYGLKIIMFDLPMYNLQYMYYIQSLENTYNRK